MDDRRVVLSGGNVYFLVLQLLYILFMFSLVKIDSNTSNTFFYRRIYCTNVVKMQSFPISVVNSLGNHKTQ